MKRSEINAAIGRAKELLDQYQWSLPHWAYWSESDYAADPSLAAHLNKHQMGWDVTDFGSGDFSRRGLTLFCLRNGVQSDPDSVPYAEKLLFVDENQETPFHCHRVKMEDIINRGGGILMVEFCHANASDQGDITVSVDGCHHVVEARVPLELRAGQSVTMTRGLYHRFYAKSGYGMVLGGEVSQVNDDGGDNYFLDDVGRFAKIDQDEAAVHPLWNEVIQI